MAVMISNGWESTAKDVKNPATSWLESNQTGLQSSCNNNPPIPNDSIAKAILPVISLLPPPTVPDPNDDQSSQSTSIPPTKSTIKADV